MARIVSDLMRVWRFVHEQTGVPLSHTMKTLGLEHADDGRLVCGVLYDAPNGVNLWMHVAMEPGANLTPRFVRYAFEYPFLELGCERVTGWVEASNTAARRFDEHLGFRVEAVLKGAASDRGDVLLYVMTRAECRWIRGRRREAPSMARCEAA
jgi:hypothetical protein